MIRDIEIIFIETNVNYYFPRCFNHFANGGLGVDISLRAGRRSPSWDTYFHFGHRGKHFSEPMEECSLRLFGHIDSLGERLKFKVPGKERIHLAHIEGGHGVEAILEDLLLGSASIEVGHSECV
jgi:hypothetical protein